jgi:hypothetical protein
VYSLKSVVLCRNLEISADAQVAHLGLCQAAGVLLAAAAAQPCACAGGVERALVAMAALWLLGAPVGMFAYLAIRLVRARRSGEIRYARSGARESLSEYAGKVWAATGSAERFCNPPTVHLVLKGALAIAALLCLVLAISAAAARRGAEAGALFAAGLVASIAALRLSSALGRLAVIAVTNACAAGVGKRFVTGPGGTVAETAVPPAAWRWAVGPALTVLGAGAAKAEVALDRDNLDRLAKRGRWARSDSARAFYGELTEEGLPVALFAIAKNVLVGVLLTDTPPLVAPPIKVEFTPRRPGGPSHSKVNQG